MYKDEHLYNSLMMLRLLNCSGNFFGMNRPPNTWYFPLKCLAHSLGVVKLISISGSKLVQAVAVQPVGQSTAKIGIPDEIIFCKQMSKGALNSPLNPNPKAKN